MKYGTRNAEELMPGGLAPYPSATIPEVDSVRWLAWLASWTAAAESGSALPEPTLSPSSASGGGDNGSWVDGLGARGSSITQCGDLRAIASRSMIWQCRWPWCPVSQRSGTIVPFFDVYSVHRLVLASGGLREDLERRRNKLTVGRAACTAHTTQRTATGAAASAVFPFPLALAERRRGRQSRDPRDSAGRAGTASREWGRRSMTALPCG